MSFVGLWCGGAFVGGPYYEANHCGSELCTSPRVHVHDVPAVHGIIIID